MKIGSDRNENKINTVEVTNDTLSNRGGLSFMFRYLDNIGITSKIEEKFGHLPKSRKGESIGECARQFMALCMDGTKHSISRFDELKKDTGYAAVLERTTDNLISTSAAKRFFRKFRGNTYSSYRCNRLSNTYRLQSRRTYTSISINKREYYFCVISEQMDKVVSFQEVYHRYEP